MHFGPDNFENLDQLLDFIVDGVLKDPEDQTTHPLRTAIAAHVHAQDIQQDHEIPRNLTITARRSLSEIFEKNATTTRGTPQEYIVHCFWDGIRKTAGNLKNATGFKALKDSILDAQRPIERSHHLILAQLKTNIYFYKKNFAGQSIQTNEAFENALSYMRETIVPELERLLVEEFSLEPGDAAKFRQDWKTTARNIVLDRDNEDKPATRPSKIPGKPARTSYPYSFGYDGIMPTKESLDL